MRNTMTNSEHTGNESGEPHPKPPVYARRLISHPRGNFLAALFMVTCLPAACAARIDVTVEQVIFGKYHHFFGYIGQSGTIP